MLNVFIRISSACTYDVEFLICRLVCRYSTPMCNCTYVLYDEHVVDHVTVACTRIAAAVSNLVKPSYFGVVSTHICSCHFCMTSKHTALQAARHTTTTRPMCWIKPKRRNATPIMIIFHAPARLSLFSQYLTLHVIPSCVDCVACTPISIAKWRLSVAFI